jgi:hypothetical protein
MSKGFWLKSEKELEMQTATAAAAASAARVSKTEYRSRTFLLLSFF